MRAIWMLSKCEAEVLSVNGLILIEVHPVHTFYHIVVRQTEVPHHQETQQRQQQKAPFQGSEWHPSWKGGQECRGHSQQLRSMQASGSSWFFSSEWKTFTFTNWAFDMSNWAFDWCWSWNSNTLATWCKGLIGKDPDARKDWSQEEKGTTEDEMVGWHHRIDGWVWVSSRSWWRTGKPGVLQSMGSQRVGHDWATKLDWRGWRDKSRSLRIKICSKREHQCARGWA